MHVCSKDWFSHLCGNTIFSEPGPIVCYNHNITGTSAQDKILFPGKIINVERHLGFAFPYTCMYVPMLLHVCSKEWFSHLCGNTIFSEPGPFVCYNHNITGTSAQD